MCRGRGHGARRESEKRRERASGSAESCGMRRDRAGEGGRGESAERGASASGGGST